MIGIDIIETKRFKEQKPCFAKMFCEHELEYANKFSDPDVHLAGFWAAKEAFLKALGTGITSLELNKIYVLHDKSNKPYLEIEQSTKQKLGIANNVVEISISHTKEIACAICIIK